MSLDDKMLITILDMDSCRFYWQNLGWYNTIMIEVQHLNPKKNNPD